MPLKSFLPPGVWKTGKQFRCNMCGRDTSWVCLECSGDKNSMVAICPEVTICRGKHAAKGQKVHHDCLCRHALNPTFFPKGKGRGGGGCKRARNAPAASAAADADEE